MDEERLLKACELVDKGKYSEAHNEFIQLAEDTPDPVEKAWPLIYAANTLQTLGQQEAATAQLNAARTLLEKHRPSISARDEKFAAAECFLDFEDANLLWLRGGNKEAALDRFDAALKKHRIALEDQRSGSLHEAFQIRRAFILADLGRWKEALPILEGIKSPQEYREGIAFYLGHCYLAGDDYERAKEKLTEALNLEDYQSGSNIAHTSNWERLTTISKIMRKQNRNSKRLRNKQTPAMLRNPTSGSGWK
jgi:predicted negative regulator of RcsB-dependent stress response